MKGARPVIHFPMERTHRGSGPAVDGNLALAQEDTGSPTFDSYSWVIGRRRPNGVTITRSYDSLNRLELIEATGPSGVLARFDYTLDAEGTRTGVSEVGGSRTWTYDPEDRLTSERITDPNLPSNGGQLVYTLDANGNRTQLVSGVTGISNQSNTLNGNDELASEAYDLNGNALSAAGHTYTYSARNELLTVDGGAVKYGYDPQGLRISKEAAGATRWYLWDDLNPSGFPQVLVEYVGSTPAAATPARTYAFGHGRISQREAATGQASFFIGDGIGTTRLLTDEGGHEAATFTYDAFGVLLARTGARTTDHLFAGEYFDVDAGLVYLRARWLDSAQGRLTSRDPIFFDRLGQENAALYVDHDPVNRVDPTGEQSLTLGEQLTISSVITVLSSSYITGRFFYQTSSNPMPNGVIAIIGPSVGISVGAFGAGNVVVIRESNTGKWWWALNAELGVSPISIFNKWRGAGATAVAGPIWGMNSPSDFEGLGFSASWPSSILHLAVPISNSTAWAGITTLARASTAGQRFFQPSRFTVQFGISGGSNASYAAIGPRTSIFASSVSITSDFHPFSELPDDIENAWAGYLGAFSAAFSSSGNFGQALDLLEAPPPLPSF